MQNKGWPFDGKKCGSLRKECNLGPCPHVPKITSQCHLSCAMCLNGKCTRQEHICKQNKSCPEGLLCISEQCFPTCNSDKDCPTTKKCSLGICYEITCLKTSDCPQGLGCGDGKCKPPDKCING